MDRRQKQVIGALGGACAVLALIVLLVALLHDDTTKKKKVVAAATTSTNPGIVGDPTTSSTISLQPVDTAPPTTPSTSTSTTRPPTTTSTTAAMPVLTGKDAVLTQPSVPVTRHVDAGAPCSQLGDGSEWTVSCDTVQAKAGRLVWVLEEKAAKGVTARRAAVWRSIGAAGTWQQVLAAADDEGNTWTGVTEMTVDVDGDGGPEAAFGFRSQGTGQILGIDVVDGNGRVTLHDSAYKGSARVPGGRLDTWSAVYPGNEPNCCPPAYRHDVVRFVGGAWRVVSTENVAPSMVPQSQL